MPGRNSQVSRIYAILDLLESAPQGLNVMEITHRVNDRGHDASKRTVYRDLEALNQAGFPLFPRGEKTDEGGVRWVLEKSAKINQYLVLSARELFALYLARGALSPLRDTPFYDDLETVFEKIEEKLGTKNRDFLDSLGMELKFEPGPQWGLGLNPEVLETVRAACSEKQVIECIYYSVNSRTERKRKLGPHYLYFAKGGLYLVAEDLQEHNEKQKVKVFSIPRMKSAEMLDEVYEGSVSTPEEYFQGALGVFASGRPETIQIEFSANVAPYVKERRWHPTQRVVQRENGVIQLSIEVSPTPELFQWILSFGPEARVLSPAHVQGSVVRLASELLESYKKVKVA